MSEPDVTVRIGCYEIDGAAQDFPLPTVRIESHWSSADRVVLLMGGHTYTVSAQQLAEAALRARRP